ncbi:MAG: Fur family transcriptional regulator, ferric uptake regulator [Pseudomonadota bacterium]|nr:Fur family transcriptional regulator, ferric uptake regulator [Pseudomonadota bacterium]
MNLQTIKNLGIKLTKHKIVILQLFDSYRHLDANQIHALLIGQGTNISLATIYRVLSNFEAKNIIIRHSFKEDQSTYELVRPNEHHDHLICIKCNLVIEFFDSKIEQLQEQIATKNKFKIVNHHLNLFGICEKCFSTDYISDVNVI